MKEQNKSTYREPFLTVAQFLEKNLIPIKKSKLYEELKTGRLPSYRLDGKVFVLESELYDAIKRKSRMRLIESNG